MIFIAGTGTNVGKTIVTAALLRMLSQHGKEAFGLKPVQTGCSVGEHGVLSAPDVELYERACPQGRHAALFCFRPACSPHLAAQEAGESYTADQLVRALSDMTEKMPPSAVACIEGSGGVMVPINRSETFLDVVRALGIPVLLVCPNELGTINHSLLSWRALRAAGVNMLGFVLTRGREPRGDCQSQAGANELRMMADNRALLEDFCALPCLGELPWLCNLHDENTTLQEKDWDRAASCLEPVVEALWQLPTNSLNVRRA